MWESLFNPILAVAAVAAAASAVWSFIGANAVGLVVTAAAAAYSVAQQRKAKMKAQAARMEAQRRAEEARRIALSRSQVAGPGHFSLDGTSFSQYNSASTNFRDSITPRRIVYGTRKLGGPIVFAHNTQKTVLHIVVALAAHEVEEIGSIWVGKEEVTLNGVNGTKKWAGKVRVEKYLGTLTQNVGTSLIALGCKNVKTTDKWKGLAVLQVRTTRFSQTFEGSPEFAAMVKGKKDIFDPRSNTHAWTDNSALILADYLHAYMGVSYNDIDIPALRAAADVCDELVPLKVAEGEEAKSEKRYTTNIAILHTQDHERTLNDLAGAMPVI